VALACAPARSLPDPFPGAAAAYLVIVDGAPRWERAADARRAPASLAKLMTALLVLDDAGLDDEVAVSRNAAAARGSRLGLHEGERVAAHGLLAAMLVGSANDACLALVERKGNVAAFVARMNAQATRLELNATRFGDPCGFDSDRQHTTARDLARLAHASWAAAARGAGGRREVGRHRGTRALVPREEFQCPDRALSGVIGEDRAAPRRNNLIALAE
jgi:D-alanyl-D-alanine carboxypeptidase